MNKNLSKFFWRTMEGEILSVEEMKTTHLFYCVRMIYNCVVSPEMRVGQLKRINLQSPEGKRRSIVNLMCELSKRDDVPDWALSQLRQMHDNLIKSDFLKESVLAIPHR